MPWGLIGTIAGILAALAIVGAIVVVVMRTRQKQTNGDPSSAASHRPTSEQSLASDADADAAPEKPSAQKGTHKAYNVFENNV